MNAFQLQQRAKASTTGDHVKALAAESSNADSIFQQLDKLRSVFEEYTKLTDEIIPLAEKSLQEFTEELEQKSEALDDVSWGTLKISLDITDLQHQSQLESLEILLSACSVSSQSCCDANQRFAHIFSQAVNRNYCSYLLTSYIINIFRYWQSQRR